jgi:lipoprotein signal peptidase
MASESQNIFNELKCTIQNDPGIMNALMVGILFSGISYGLLYVIVFIIIWEFLYFAYLHANHRNWEMTERVMVILYGILGFLLGRFLHEDDDHCKECNDFFNDCEYYGKNFGWF